MSAIANKPPDTRMGQSSCQSLKSPELHPQSASAASVLQDEPDSFAESQQASAAGSVVRFVSETDAQHASDAGVADGWDVPQHDEDAQLSVASGLEGGWDEVG